MRCALRAWVAAAAASPGNVRALLSPAIAMRPPCASTYSRAIARPRPLPSIGLSALRRPRKKLLNTASRSSAGMPGPESMTSSVAASLVAAGKERDLAAARRVLDRVAEQVVEHRAQLVGVGFQAHRIERRASAAAPWTARRAPWAATTSRTSASSETGAMCSDAAACSARW